MSFQHQPSSRRHNCRRRNTKIASAAISTESPRALETRRPSSRRSSAVGDNNGQPPTTIYDFKDTDEEIIRIIVGGDTPPSSSATFDEDTKATTLGDLTPAPVGDDDPNADLPGSDLFAIYVEESDAGSFIAVSGLDEDANPPEVRPYEGNVTLTVRDLQDNGNWTSMSTDDGTGVASRRTLARHRRRGRLRGPPDPLRPLDRPDRHSPPWLRRGPRRAHDRQRQRLSGCLRRHDLRARPRHRLRRSVLRRQHPHRRHVRAARSRSTTTSALTATSAISSCSAPSAAWRKARGTPSTGPAISPASTSSSGSLQFNARQHLRRGKNQCLEPQRDPHPRSRSSRAALEWDGGHADTDQFFNDTFATPQYIGTIDDDDIRVRGTLTASTTTTSMTLCRLLRRPPSRPDSARIEGIPLLMNLGIFDPDGY